MNCGASGCQNYCPYGSTKVVTDIPTNVPGCYCPTYTTLNGSSCINSTTSGSIIGLILFIVFIVLFIK